MNNNFSEVKSIPEVSNLDGDDFYEKISGDTKAIIIDVRTPSEYVGKRIPNSKLIDIMHPDFSDLLAELDKGNTYYLYCQSGSRSYQACREMLKIGFTDVYNLENGIYDWKGETESDE